MSKLKPTTPVNDSGAYKFDLSVFSFFQEGTWYMVSPALDLTGAGDTEAEAKAVFGITLNAFVRQALSNNSMLAELKKNGWDIIEEEPLKIVPPSIEKLKANAEFADIWKHHPKEHSKSFSFSL